MGLFGTKFSRNTLNKPQYRALWHPKYIQESEIEKQPGFSFKLVMGCFKAIAQKVVATIQLLLDYERHITDKKHLQKQASQDAEKAIAPNVCSICKNESEKTFVTQATQKLRQSDRTFMKCCVGFTPYLVYRVFVLKLELIKQKLKQNRY